MRALLLSLLFSLFILQAFAQSYVTALPVNGAHLSQEVEENIKIYRGEHKVYLQLKFPKDLTQRVGEIFSDNLGLRSKMENNTQGWKVKQEGYRFSIYQGVLEVHILKDVISKMEREQIVDAVMETFFVLEIKVREDEL